MLLCKQVKIAVSTSTGTIARCHHKSGHFWWLKSQENRCNNRLYHSGTIINTTRPKLLGANATVLSRIMSDVFFGVGAPVFFYPFNNTRGPFVPHRRQFSNLSCSPHFFFPISFTEHTRKKNKKQAVTEGEKRCFRKSRNQEINRSRLTIQPSCPDLASFLQNRWPKTSSPSLFSLFPWPVWRELLMPAYLTGFMK